MFQFVAVVGVEGQFHVGSSEDEPGPTSKMMKHSTSTRLLKTFGRIESFTIAFNLLKNNFHFYQHVLDTKKKKNAKTAVTMQTFD